MTEQRDALLRLLSDDDPATVALVKSQLTSGGPATLPALHALRTVATDRAWRHLTEVIGIVKEQRANDAFAELCGSFGEQGDIEDAAWRLAATFSPAENFSKERAILNAWGAEVRRRLRKAAAPIDRIETLTEFLGDEVGLVGNTDDYYNINNSLLPEVIDTRLGIPVSLSLVYILVAQRAGLELHGVNIPGHFLVRQGEHFFDPFHGGCRVGLDGCRALASQHKVPLSPHHLRPTTSRQMLLRILGNIYNIAEESDPPLAAKLQSWVESLHAPQT